MRWHSYSLIRVLGDKYRHSEGLGSQMAINWHHRASPGPRLVSLRREDSAVFHQLLSIELVPPDVYVLRKGSLVKED